MTWPRYRTASQSVVCGDSHAALFGHGVREPGVVKATYGTGTSVMGLGVISGLTLGTGRAQLARAALESIAHQIADVVSAVRRSGVRIDHLLADGGASVNDTLMRLQADLAGVEVQRSAALDVSAIGAAHLARLTVGLWDEPALAARTERRASFHPRANTTPREAALAGWRDAMCRARGLAVDRIPEPTRPSETSPSASV